MVGRAKAKLVLSKLEAPADVPETGRLLEIDKHISAAAQNRIPGKKGKKYISFHTIILIRLLVLRKEIAYSGAWKRTKRPSFRRLGPALVWQSCRLLKLTVPNCQLKVSVRFCQLL
jgi:hypothetical protein